MALAAREWPEPRLEVSNSTRGVAMLEALSDRFGLHMFDHTSEPASPVGEVDVDVEHGTVTIELRGELDFVAAEQVVHDVRRLVEHTGATTVRLDFGDVTAVSEIAERLLRETSRAAEAAGLVVENLDEP